MGGLCSLLTVFPTEGGGGRVLKEGTRGFGSLFIFKIFVLSCCPPMCKTSSNTLMEGEVLLSRLALVGFFFFITPSLSNTSTARASSASAFTDVQ
jgi:hypothetical protein